MTNQEAQDAIAQANHQVFIEARDLIQCFPIDIPDGEIVNFNIPGHRVERLRDAINAVLVAAKEQTP